MRKLRLALAVGLPIIALHGVVLWSIAHSALNDRMGQWEDRQRTFDPHELWSVEVLPAQAGWAPVQLCTDARARGGFLQPMPTVDGQPCMADDKPRRHGDVVSYRCTVGAAQFANSATLAGDLQHDFTTTYRITRLGGGESHQQTRRYRRLGFCPPGWSVGDHTDRSGVRASGAMKEVPPS